MYEILILLYDHELTICCHVDSGHQLSCRVSGQTGEQLTRDVRI